jgi:hypothetical protein
VKRFGPSAERSKHALLAVLERVLPARGVVLELASGTGQHVAHFAAALPGLTWQPSERDDGAAATIAAWTAGLDNVLPALTLDVTAAPWPCDRVAAVIASSLLQVGGLTLRDAVLAGAATRLDAGAPLCLYGLFTEGAATPAREIEPHLASWTVAVVPPRLDDVRDAAAAAGFDRGEVIAVGPEDQRMLVLRRAPA